MENSAARMSLSLCSYAACRHERLCASHTKLTVGHGSKNLSPNMFAQNHACKHSKGRLPYPRVHNPTEGAHNASRERRNGSVCRACERLGQR